MRCGRALRRRAVAACSASGRSATKIERVVTPGGIEVWLVRDATVPLIAIDFGFRGGATQDPADKAGIANMMVSLLDEGAGDLDAKAFHERLERKAIELNFNAGRDTIRGTLRTLKENQDEAFELLRLALTAPRFETAAVERIRVAAHVAAAARRPRARTTSPAAPGGAPPFPAIPMGARPTARSSRCRASPSTT